MGIFSKNKRYGLALSGGGFRATLFHLGVISYLRDSRKLQNVSHICAVSGGSIMAAHLVKNWDLYANGSDEEFERAKKEIIRFVRRDVRGRLVRRLPFIAISSIVRRLPFIGKIYPTTRALFLEKEFDAGMNFGITMDNLPNTPVVYLLTTNMTNGGACSFTQEGFSIDFEQNNKSLKSRLINSITPQPLSLAVVCSSAFPGLLPPLHIDYITLGLNKSEYTPNPQTYIDGGVFDNLGVRKLLQIDKELKSGFDNLIISDASITFDEQWLAKETNIFGTAIRATDILSNRIHELERERLSINEEDLNKIVDVRISDCLDKGKHILPKSVQTKLQHLRTDLDLFSYLEIKSLIYHGYYICKEKFTDKNSYDFGKGENILLHSENKIVKHLQNGQKRKWRFFSFRDWVWIPQTILLVIFIFWIIPNTGAVINRIHNIIDPPPKIIKIGSKKFLESSILAELMAQQIEQYTHTSNLKVIREFHRANNQLLFYHVLTRQIDLYAEYSGTILAVHLNININKVRLDDELHEEESINTELHDSPNYNDIKVLPRLGFSNSYKLVMLRDNAREKKLLKKGGDYLTMSDIFSTKEK